MHQNDGIWTNDALQGQLRPTAGARVRSREVGGLAIAEARYPANGRSAWHSHELAGLAVVLTGGYLKRMHRTDHQCAAGTMTLEPAGVSHAESYGNTEVRVLLVEFTPWRHALIDQEIQLPDAPVCGRAPVAVTLARRAVRELRTGDSATPLVLEGLALELIGVASRSTGQAVAAPSWLAQVIERIRDDFRSHHTLDELARGAGVHPAHLTRAFRSANGCSIGEFVRQLRIEWAAEQLLAASTPLSFVAVQAGFYDQSHFTRVFTRQMGVAPSRYRALRLRG